MQKRVFAFVGLLALGTTSVVVLLRHRRTQRERREFAERYAKQLRAAREVHKQSLLGFSGDNVSHHSVDVSETEKDENGAVVHVIYGSESGNAEALAKGFAISLRDRGVQTALVDPSRWAYLEEYLYSNKENVPLFHPIKAAANGAARAPLVYIFIVATAGEGEPTGNFISLFHEMQLAVQKATTPTASSSAVASAADTPAPTATTRPELPFKDIYHAVFGLGDSSYKYYCRCATDTNTLLKKGGGINLHRVGFGDARSGLQEDVFDEWQEQVMKALEEKCGLVLTTGTRAPPKPEYVFRYLYAGATATPDAAGTTTTDAAPSSSATKADINTTKESGRIIAEPRENSIQPSPARLPFPPPPALLEPSLLNPARIRVLSKVQLTPPRDSDGSSVYRFCFETAGTGISYQAGDHLSIFPTNPPEMVARCAAALAIPESDLGVPVELCRLVPSRGLLHNVLPACVPLSVVLQCYVDLCGRPKKSTLRVLAKYCTAPAEQEEFFRLISLPAGHQGEEAAKSRKLRTVVDYLEKFPSCCCIPLGHLIEVMPRIQPRFYSIASDRLSHGTQVEIMVRVLTDGLASSYLGHRVHEGDEVFSYVRISSFHLPQRISEGRPLLMIGPGTGAAAMMGLCYKKEALMRKQPTAQYGPTMFLFGAQHRATEYFVEDEVRRWSMTPEEMRTWDAANQGSHAGVAAHRSKAQPPALLPTSVITHHDSAFSRDQEKKIYVTDLIEKHKDQIYDMLTSTCGGGCLVYLSGDASFMAKDVDRALSALLQNKGGMTRIVSLEFLRRMEADHRYLKDVY
ncbi:putative mitochondrial cytochrome P450 reductase [Leptomonas pyrrhocoris]|uniref:Putative mitochondrial cytochrome P450 reductase n=1 Tax=Leptomonas pyrrhocoris TaxID=157538 RepID=A0A0N0E0A8_LEPPY|nr:putative mitochondrial cytochrome P450 reductase [Leptomonas pyrrhocoris]XP_015664674.1 putative mitochondrial cytochrome P450 reductase [Leptomonas pyrrhocoris]KPA86234.1 putative mitochondrial cytochrome P450 reductase [Leptomonas pyrrhocoris]KPA86235.1 putative mitochondrial cytochrome P450 reductase [Leptomonas pyrrhocoris]|eukprot:XP_015664673.1 putative mitochondrial cytochrome P450 reductase [Leptomonas pyrrhocoris]